MEELRDGIIKKLKILNETVWEGKADNVHINAWLENFSEDTPNNPSESLHALYLLRQFMYFGSRQIRELLKALFRDLYRYPIIENIRRDNNHTVDMDFIHQAFTLELSKTKFLGIGNPSESGSHLLYYFRQENNLPKNSFIHSHQIFDRYGTPSSPTIRFQDVTRYIFIDDLCGSGTQAETYSQQVLVDLKRLKPDVQVAYYMLFATTHGLNRTI